MAMPITSPFLWGKQGQMLTPEQVARERDSAAVMAQGAANFKPAGHWAEGLGRVVQGLMAGYDMRRADKAESEGMASADELVRSNPTLSSYLGGDQQAPQGVQQPGAQIVDALAGPASVPQGGNFPASLIQSESGGNWNALNSEGYGGRLQFGEARLADAARAGIIPAGMTGAQFSQMAPEQQQEVENWHFSDIDSQAERMGLNQYLGHNIGGTQVTQDGIRAMAHLGGIGGAKRFLESGGQHNPADSNGTSLGKYLAQHGGGMPGAAPAGPSQAPNSVVAALAHASGNPWVQKKYGPVIEALMGQEMQRSNAQYQQQLAQQDPMYQAQLQHQQMQNQSMMNPPAPKPVYEGGQWWDTSSGVPTPLTDPRFNTLSPEEVADLGLPPGAYQRGADGKISQIGGGGINLSIGGGPKLGTLSTDFGYVSDPETGDPVIDPDTGLPTAAPIPGSPAARDISEAAVKEEARASLAANSANIVMQDIDKAIGQVSGWTSGAGSMLARFPGSGARDLQASLDTVRANIGFDRLQQMRESSPTGGALGGIAVPELEMLQAVLGSLDTSQSPEQLRANLERLKQVYEPIAAKAAAYPNAAEFGFGTPVDVQPSNEGWQDVGGVKIRRKQ